MSRTHHNTKGPGYDFMGRRALSLDCGHGRDVKDRTHRVERRRSKSALRRGVDLPKHEAF